MTFDPRRISYQDLLDIFWSGQPVNVAPGPNHRADLAVMPRGTRQRTIAEQAKSRLRSDLGEEIHVDLVPDPAFWPAERLHQKFNLQRAHPELVADLAADFPSLDAFLASTAAARLNAWLGPFGGEAALRDAARRLGRDVEDLRHRLADGQR